SKAVLCSLVKIIILSLVALISACSLPAEDVAPKYSNEAALPRGWPTPGPYNEVSEKEIPAYRAAFTDGTGSFGSFWTLFNHIKKNDIPMTAPVEMAMEEENGDMEMASMGFLYQNTEVGKTGKDGEKVEVRDVPKEKVLSYTWMGGRSDESLKTAKAALEKALAEKKLTLKSYRLLGYNGPGTPVKKRTHELQALLK
ncbi:heme-binding protein, partial [Akkermansiaceae bacterium]|nr:heme-binding protein [Akkermansiaceae bacterium]